MPKSSGRGGNGRDRGEGDTGRSRGEEDTRRREEEDTRRREDEDELSDGYKPEQFPEGNRPEGLFGDLYRNSGDGASEIGAKGEVSYGPAKVGADISAGVEHQWSDGKYQVGADAEAKIEGNVGLVGLGANARANVGVHAADGRYQVGAEASINSEVKLGNSNETGNEFAVGVGAGVGGGGELIVGADADGDGQKEYGTSVSLKVIGGGSIGFRVEPEAVKNKIKDILGISKDKREVPKEEETHKCAERIHELGSSLEMRRTKEAYARLQSVLSG